MSDSSPQEAPQKAVSLIETPPTSPLGILSRLGPGLIIAGSIVGSGELIGTTSTGGKAGYVLLWLILIGCVIKVFVQVEFGRFSLVTGQTTMDGLNELPGPRLPRLGNWIIWYWSLMMIASLGQLGGIVGGVGQAMAISVPLTQAGRDYNELMTQRTQMEVKRAELRMQQKLAEPDASRIAKLESEIGELTKSMRAAEATDARYTLIFNIWEAEERVAGLKDGKDPARLEAASLELSELKQELAAAGHAVGNDRSWAWILTIVTAILLVLGRYRMIETATTALVAGFTFITIINVVMLQLNPVWCMTWDDLKSGLTFQLPQGDAAAAITMALATFGIIGVGTNELLAYPYFCIEKGYARFTGPRDKSASWAARARGWMRVMRVDAWCSMVVYTFATVAFYFLGASILFPIGLDPQGTEMIRTLSVMYEPIFGAYAPALFLVGAFAVLYSTFFVANAGHARVCADVVRVVSGGAIKKEAFYPWVRGFSGVLPFICLAMYLFFGEPRTLVFVSGFMQNLMLPMLAFGALYFRYRRCDDRIRPSLVWDAFLWLSAIGLLVVAGWALYNGYGRLMEWLA